MHQLSVKEVPFVQETCHYSLQCFVELRPKQAERGTQWNLQVYVVHEQILSFCYLYEDCAAGAGCAVSVDFSAGSFFAKSKMLIKFALIFLLIRILLIVKT